MTNKMLKFVKIGQQNHLKEMLATEKEDFNEIYDDLLNKKLKSNPADALQCGVPLLSSSLSTKQ